MVLIIMVRCATDAHKAKFLVAFMLSSSALIGDVLDA